MANCHFIFIAEILLSLERIPESGELLYCSMTPLTRYNEMEALLPFLLSRILACATISDSPGSGRKDNAG
jgi:hypothetical protein